MAITVTHSKVSTIPDGDDTSVVRPSDWNADHQIVGTVPVANGGTGAATLTGYVKGNGTSTMTASSTIPNTDITGLGTASTKDAGSANGVATLDSGGKVPVSELPAAVLGALSYQGTWNASTNTPTLTSSVGTKGYYYVVSVAGSTNLNGITDWKVGDWAVFNGSEWQKIDNTDAVTSVNGYTGTVVLTNTDISGFGTMSTQNANSVAITGGSINGTTIGATTASTGAFTTATASTSLTTPIVQASNSGGLSLKNSAGTTQISMGGGGGDNVSINVATNINGTNAQIDISPTGTGHVHMKPTGTGSIEIAPTNVGTMDNMTIGATTPKAITGTTITATTFSGSGASLTSIPNSALVNSAITINGTSTSLGGSISVGTVTSVTGTSPVVSSGGNTPAISMPAATTSVSGYLTSTDWNTFNNKGSGTVTSVTATSPVTSTGGTTPVIAMPAATTSVNGYLTSTDWTTFNGKANAFTYTSNYIPYGQGTTTPTQSVGLQYNGTTFTTTGISTSNNLSFTGTGNRISGDMNNATLANRLAFQTSNTNSVSVLSLLPNGTSTTSGVACFANSDPTNTSYALIADTAGQVSFRAAISGTGTYEPMTMFTGGSERLRIDTGGNVIIGATSGGGKFTVTGGLSFLQRNAAGTQEVLKLDNSDTTAGTQTAKLSFSSSTVTKASITSAVYGNGYMAFATNDDTEKMRIDANGNVGIGTTSPNASAILDAQSTTKGVRMPNMTTTQKNAISSPAAGLMVFDTTLAKLCVYSGSAWQTITSI